MLVSEGNHKQKENATWLPSNLAIPIEAEEEVISIQGNWLLFSLAYCNRLCWCSAMSPWYFPCHVCPWPPAQASVLLCLGLSLAEHGASQRCQVVDALRSSLQVSPPWHWWVSQRPHPSSRKTSIDLFSIVIRDPEQEGALTPRSVTHLSDLWLQGSNWLRALFLNPTPHLYQSHFFQSSSSQWLRKTRMLRHMQYSSDTLLGLKGSM